MIQCGRDCGVVDSGLEWMMLTAANRGSTSSVRRRLVTVRLVTSLCKEKRNMGYNQPAITYKQTRGWHGLSVCADKMRNMGYNIPVKAQKREAWVTGQGRRAEKERNKS